MPAVTEADKGPLVNVAMWVTIVPMSIAVLAKIYTKWNVTQKLFLDDLSMILAAALAVAQSITTSEQVKFGLGKHEVALTEKQRESFLKFRYSSEVLYVACIFTSKASTLFFFPVLAGPHSQKRLVYFVLMLTTGWGTVGVLVAAFQCQLPTPWVKVACVDMTAFWVATAVADVLTQIALSLLPICLLKNLQAARRKRIVSMLAFTPNLLAIVLSGLRLKHVLQASRSTDQTWDSFNLSLTTSLHALVSVMLSAVPFSKPIIDSMVLLPILINGGVDGNPAFTTSTALAGKTSTNGSGRLPRIDLGATHPRRKDVGNFTDISAKPPEAWELHEYESRNGSQDRMVIHQTTSTIVTSSPWRPTNNGDDNDLC